MVVKKFAQLVKNDYLYTIKENKSNNQKQPTMKRYTFNIMQRFGDYTDDQNVWVRANSEAEAIQEIKSEYHSIVDITLISVQG